MGIYSQRLSWALIRKLKDRQHQSRGDIGIAFITHKVNNQNIVVYIKQKLDVFSIHWYLVLKDVL